MTQRKSCRLLVGIGVVVLALLTGCSVNQPYQPTPSTAATKALAQLQTLPSLEETAAQLENALNQISAAASQRIPKMVWITATNGDTGSCSAPYDKSDGQSSYLPNRIAEDVPVSEDDWKVLVGVARDAAAKLGATDEQVMQDEAGKHDVWFSGPAGLSLKFSYKGNMVVAAYTGCRLPSGKNSPS